MGGRAYSIIHLNCHTGGNRDYNPDKTPTGRLEFIGCAARMVPVADGFVMADPLGKLNLRWVAALAGGWLALAYLGGCGYLILPTNSAPRPAVDNTSFLPAYPMWLINKPMPAAAPTQQVGVSSPQTTGPAIWAWCWTAPESGDEFLYPMVWVHRRDYGNPAAIAARTAQLPPGKVALFLWNAGGSLLTNPANACRTATGATAFPSPWLSAGAGQIAQRLRSFFQGYRAAGGRLNYLVMDYEAGLSCWQISRQNADAISHDPRFPQITAQLGFSDIARIFKPGTARRAWNQWVGSQVATALNQAYFLPAADAFPGISASNYDGLAMLGDHVAPDINGHFQPSDQVFGNAQSPAFYGDIGLLAGMNVGGHACGATPYAILRYEMIYLQAIQQTSSIPIVPWVGYPGYASFASAPGYYKELIDQLALRGVNQFLFWNPRAWDPNLKPMATPPDDTLLNGCLAVLNQRLGPTPGAPIAPSATVGVSWNSPLLVAGRITSDGTVLYRVTVPPGTAAIRVWPGNETIRTAGRTGIWVSGTVQQPLQFVPAN